MDAAGNTDAEWASVIMRVTRSPDAAFLRERLEMIVHRIKKQTTANVLDHLRAEKAAAEFPETLERLKAAED